MPTARERVRAELTAEITDAARRQLAEVGAAALSLRAVAREVGMVSSAVYRYFPSRDELLTQLIIDGYDDLGAAAEAADVPSAPNSPPRSPTRPGVSWPRSEPRACRCARSPASWAWPRRRSTATSRAATTC